MSKIHIGIFTDITTPIERQIIQNHPEWNDFEFTINDEQQDYDYLFVINNLNNKVKRCCPEENTFFIAYEPPEIHVYTEKFLNQFQWVLNFDENCKHPGLVDSHHGYPWLVGCNPTWLQPKTHVSILNFNQLQDLNKDSKTKTLSIMATNMGFIDGHHDRYKFALALKEHFGSSIDIYGRGTNTIHDKREALENYRFSVVIENCQHKNYFTEKIMDSFLCGTYPLYFGCTNLSDFFPKNSYLELDIFDINGSIEKINQAIANNIDKKYANELEEARNLTLFKYNTFQLIIDLIKQNENRHTKPKWKPRRLSYQYLLPYNSDLFKESITEHDYRQELKRLNYFTKQFIYHKLINSKLAPHIYKVLHYLKLKGR